MPIRDIFSLKGNRASALFTLLLALMLGYSLLFKGKEQVYYQTDMVCMSNGLNNKIIGEMIEKLNILAQSGSFNELAKTLNIDEEQAKSIISIKTKNILGKPILNDTVHRSNTILYFIVKAHHRRVFTQLQPALLSYLNGTPYQELRIQSEKERIDKKALFLNGDLANIDSIISSYPAFLKHVTSVSISDSTGSFFNVANVIALLSYKDRTEDRLLYEAQTKNFMTAVEMVHGFLCPEKPENETLRSILTILVIACSAVLLWLVSVNLIKKWA